MNGILSDILSFAGTIVLVLWIGSVLIAAAIMHKKGDTQLIVLFLILLTGPIGLFVWLFIINKVLD